MEQMYLVEIFIDKVTIFVPDSEEQSGATKKLIIKIKFGPKVQFIIKEGQLAPNDENKDDIVECDEDGRRKWSRTIRVGKSYLFPSYPDTVLMILSKFPLEIEIWNDDENEVEIFVGIGTMHWDTAFFHMLKETAEACKLHEPLSIKTVTPIFAECCCRQCGEVAFILRLSALGESIVTEFQQLMKDPDTFVFRTNKAPSMFQCKRIEGDDPNFCMIGSLYETTTLEDPDVVNNAQKKIEVCTELQSCGVGKKGGDYRCEHDAEGEKEPKKTYPIDKIRMGDITGPCGNTNCPLAHKVRTYIRNLEAYKKQGGTSLGTKEEGTRKICGTCDCKDDKYHRGECPEKQKEADTGKKVTCSGCGGVVPGGETCEDRQNKLKGTGATPRHSPSKGPSKTTVNYVYSTTNIPDFKRSLFGKDFIIENVTTNYDFQSEKGSTSKDQKSTSGCCCRKPLEYNTYRANVAKVDSTPSVKMNPKTIISSPSLRGTNVKVFNAESKESGMKKFTTYNCTTIQDDTECKCSPKKPSPPCKTFDCECITETANLAARKSHRPYCPSFKHKSNCPVTMSNDEDEKKKQDDDEDEAEPLPYGLPPIKLGPCPVMGRPCAYPDGFAKMYKTAAQPALPESFSDAGKVCCSKEYERIKKALKTYMKYEKDHDHRCINKFDVDTERRCCDKEQRLLALMGKGCCGSHKMAIQEKFKKDQHKMNTEDQKDSCRDHKIRICGPCGKTTCPLVRQFKTYIRDLEAYRNKDDARKASKLKRLKRKKNINVNKENHKRSCSQNNSKQNDRSKIQNNEVIVNAAIKGIDYNQIQAKDDSQDRKDVFGITSTPMGSKSTIAYVSNVNKSSKCNEPTSMFGNEYILESLFTSTFNFLKDKTSTAQTQKPPGKCQCRGINIADLPDHVTPSKVAPQNVGVNTLITRNPEFNNPALKKYNIFNCLTIQEDTECKCSPPKPSPPCKTFDCECIAEMGNIAARKQHRAYCPLFKHKSNCPVMMKNKDDDLEEDEEEAEPLPYGLPPIHLGPCPVMGKPCSYPDGFAKMYKTAALPALPASYSDSGKVCCSKEYERIKKALADYMRYEKDHDHRCINTFNVDTERRCCDKEQRLISLMGKDCCGSHKLAIQAKYKEDKH